jgi:glycerol-3-phosphate O-acyltransferase / dihydroxyacetone phosphate acyltransferase
MLWYFLQFALTPLFPSFFKRLQSKNIERARVKQPLLIAMNHPNSFMDAMAFTYLLQFPRTYFMARGDAFKKGMVSKLLYSIGLLPIFRFKDVGYESAKKNVDSFRMVYKKLAERRKLIVFAEGYSVQERRLIPIKKGTAKMALGFIEQGGRDDIQILPVGVTYSTPATFRGDAYFQVGEPILVKDYYEEYKQHPPQAIIKLTKEIEDRLKPLTLNLNDKENDTVIEQLQFILKAQYLEEHHLNYHKLEDHQKYWQFIVAKLNNLTAKHPRETASFREEVNVYYNELKQLKLRDHLIYEASKDKSYVTIVNLFLLLVGFPVYAIGKALNFIPYYFAKRVADKTCKNIEFYTAVNFGVGSLILIVLLPIEVLIVWLIFKCTNAILIYIFIKSAFGFMGLQYTTFKKKILGAFRLKKIKNTNTDLYNNLLNQRELIINFIMKIS